MLNAEQIAEIAERLAAGELPKDIAAGMGKTRSVMLYELTVAGWRINVRTTRTLEPITTVPMRTGKGAKDGL